MSNRKRGFVDFRAVKAGVSMLQILEHYDLLPTFRRSQNGENLTGPCPLHGGTKPDQFKVSLVKNVWNCFSECHHGGNVLDFVAKKEDCSIREAAVCVTPWFDLEGDIVYGETNERREALSSSVRETPPRASAQVRNDANHLEAFWPILTPEERRQIVECVAERIVIDKGEISIDLLYLPSVKELSKREWSLAGSNR